MLKSMRILFARARAGQALAPFERAFLKLVQSFLTTATLALVPLLGQLEQSLINGAAIDWHGEIRLLGLAFLVAVAHAIVKYFRAHADPLPPTQDGVAGAVGDGVAGGNATNGLPLI